MRPRRIFQAALCGLIACSAGGCPGLGPWLPGQGNTVTVQIVNDTGYEVVPRIFFDDEAGWFQSLFGPGEQLATGDLLPGDFLEFPMACDRVALLASVGAGQYESDDDLPIGQADPTRILKRGDDFDCGDVIQFQFLGTAGTFGVVVSINGVIVD